MPLRSIHFAYSLPKAVQGLGNRQKVQGENNRLTVSLLHLKTVQGKDVTRASSPDSVLFVSKLSELTLQHLKSKGQISTIEFILRDIYYYTSKI